MGKQGRIHTMEVLDFCLNAQVRTPGKDTAIRFVLVIEVNNPLFYVPALDVADRGDPCLVT